LENKAIVQMIIKKIFPNVDQKGYEAAKKAGDILIDRINENGQASIVLATGASQFTVLDNLVKNTEIDWSKIVMFHLDEYIGIPSSHPASFRKYLKKGLLIKFTG
jgi:glucosamine-6-phosphate deaminase